MNNNGPWGNISPIAPMPETKILIMQLKIFRREDYKTTELWERDINNFLYKKQRTKMPNQITSMAGEVHILYGSELT